MLRNPDDDVIAVVFDLGGVLADFGGVGPMRQLAGIDSDEELWRRWLSCEHVRQFERGGCSPEEFAVGLVTEWGLDIDPDRFLADFSTWLVGPYDGAVELVTEVSERATVACLSNTNAVHWEAGASQWPLLDAFDHTFLSFQLGLVKPDREVFEQVVAVLDVTPDRVLFLDDNAINVTAARAAGLRAERVQGIDRARAALPAIGLLTDRRPPRA